MEQRKHEYKVVMDDGADTVVLGDLADLDLADAAYMVAVAKHPRRNVYLRQGARILKQNLGEPAAPPLVDPNLKDWSVYWYGRRREYLGFVLAPDEASALAAAAEKFNFQTEAQRKRLSVEPARR